MNLILENTNQVKYFTFLPEVFEALGVRALDYEWYLSDVETNGFNVREGWYSGKELNALISTNNVQFIWGVISAFKTGVRPKIVNEPYIAGNPNYWNGSNPSVQAEGAVFEVGCWDSSATLLIGLDEKLSSKYSSVYSDAKQLRDA
ncbi:hypothetical protein [Reinekea blandensis]|uniref:Uncharacterized protein n=1 Tax=Reinekea blandensis MED297 TaxID=314283 RepID=A4BKJ9_9GAMM|nr:hypothetical protein [Reinekea blandensis]EAR07352.1 hypothetical protein MED297_07681 [Reinekea sp. MED297] [Reinekea blandensis MED297]